MYDDKNKRETMKTIGLIGGMSFESSAEYYRIINEAIRQKRGGNNSAQIVMRSVNFQEIENLQFQGDKGWEALNEKMADEAFMLQQGGAECVAICTNLMHRTAPAVQENIRIPLIHIVEAVGDEIQKRGLKKIGLLGAIFTMTNDFYKKPLHEEYGLEVLTPSEEDMQEVSRIIYEELCQGKFLDSSKRFLQEVISRLQEDGAEGGILGCTELPLILQEGDAKIDLLDTTRIHAEALVRFSLSSA